MTSRSIRIAIVGSGWWAETHHIPSVVGDPHAELVAIIDRRDDRAAALAARFGVGHVFSGVEEFVASDLVSTGGIDGVIIATPHATHYAVARLLIASRLHVLVEKPLTTQAVDAIELIDLARHHNVHISVGYTAQYSRAAGAVRDWVRAELGELSQVIIEFSSRAAALYVRGEGDANSAYSAANGGGQASSQLSHAIAAMLWATGEQVSEVAALTHNRGLRVDVDDAVIFRLSSGVSGVASSTGAVAQGARMRHHIRYIGAHGIVDHDLLYSTARLQRASGEEYRVTPEHNRPAYPADEPARAFVELIAGRGKNFGPALPAARAVAFVEAIHRSVEQHAFVRVAVVDEGS